ncbi:MAG: hypothetical protein Q8M15_01770 [Bacteroidota bacterium]|nr:hypothetical protein [Bacteroidota bacterium]
MHYPRVLILTINRINKTDNSSNGLLVRNLFNNFPQKNLAQIYSGGSNGDAGFFGSYYKIEQIDRRLGRFFFKFKNITQVETKNTSNNNKSNKKPTYKQLTHFLGEHLLMKTGLYELVFRPRLSREMIEWIDNFHPDILFTQGYNLSFTILPLIISKRIKVPIAYYPADDWPDYCYLPEEGHGNLITLFVRSRVKKLSNDLVRKASVHIAFNNPMKNEYLWRYGIAFNLLMQGDDFTRFEAISSTKTNDQSEYIIVSTGDFSHPRLSLLEDLNKACEILNAEGLNVRAKIFPANNLEYIISQLNHCQFLQFESCPTHEGMVPVLLSADILFLPERFGTNPERVRLSVSSKAHLFMFSGKAIIVYSHPLTGILRYAKEEGWASIVEKRSPENLAITLRMLLTDSVKRQQLIDRAHLIATKNHLLPQIQDNFCKLLQAGIQDNFISK